MNRAIRSLIAGLSVVCCVAGTSRAAETGSSNYFQGSYGDFAAGMVGPSGLYSRVDLLYYDAQLPLGSLGRSVGGHVAQAAWGSFIKVAYVADNKINFLGATYNASIALPVLVGSRFATHVDGRAPRVAPDGNVSGIGDAYIAPIALAWQFGSHHLNANLSFIAPIGDYDESRSLNIGRNYWSFDPYVNYTWLDERRGHEFSLTAGYMTNRENPDTHYRTGDEMHVDFMFAQHFSAHFALGVAGYWYQQATHDEFDLPAGFTAKDFDASGVGIGPALLYSRRMGNREIVFFGKWIRDVHSDNRLDGDVVFLSVATKL